MRAQLPGLDLGVYARAVPLLLRNPVIIVVPLLMAVIGVALSLTGAPSGGGFVGTATGGLMGLIVRLLQLFGLGVACIIADEAWRRGSASFERGWSDAQRRAGDIFFTAIGITLIFAVASYAGLLLGLGNVALALVAIATVFLIWAIPAAAVGGIPGGAAIQTSIERVRSAPLPAILVAVVYVALTAYAVPWAATEITLLLSPYAGGEIVLIELLINALLQAIAIGYIALVVTKLYTDSAFGRRW
ncbi:MAG: hypothetical protein JO103_04980 [Candidatus Eremiobacteraeota bacterium]|nr:hypothetical protein [Candidatus Eremiobacteraeota bacterium]